MSGMPPLAPPRGRNGPLWGLSWLVLGVGVTLGFLAVTGVIGSSTSEATAAAGLPATTMASPEPVPAPEPAEPEPEYGERFAPLFDRVARLQGFFENIRLEAIANARDREKLDLVADGAERLSEDFVALYVEIEQLGPPPPEWEAPIDLLLTGVSWYAGASLTWSEALRQEDARSELAGALFDQAHDVGDEAKRFVDDAMAQLAPLLPPT